MYTFAPLPDVPVDHVGFVMVVFVAILTVIITTWNEEWEKLAAFAVSAIAAALVVLFAYCVSYVWTDQTPKTYANTPVTAEFVEFVAEGYAITVPSGKTSRTVDKHNTYVVYSVDGTNVMLNATVGADYPKTAVLYKN